jgi:hypothetical protein
MVILMPITFTGAILDYHRAAEEKNGHEMCYNFG